MNFETADLKVLIGCINPTKFKDENFLKSIVGAFFKTVEGFTIWNELVKPLTDHNIVDIYDSYKFTKDKSCYILAYNARDDNLSKYEEWSSEKISNSLSSILHDISNENITYMLYMTYWLDLEYKNETWLIYNGQSWTPIRINSIIQLFMKKFNAILRETKTNITSDLKSGDKSMHLKICRSNIENMLRKIWDDDFYEDIESHLIKLLLI